MSGSHLEIQIGSSMQDIDAAQWNALVRGCSPFLRHEFLNALEISGSVTATTGWEPSHLTVQQNGRLIAAMPLYRKHHSYGEYVFDWSWADAYQRYGQAYYPKLLTAIPFTPSQSPRLLFGQGVDISDMVAGIVVAVQAYAEKTGASSWHILFPDDQSAQQLSHENLIQRQGCQFHWRNRGYKTFEDFLSTFSSRKRKNLRKERSDVQAQSIVFERYEGNEISEVQWEVFYRYYQNTYLVRGQQAYLSPEFFAMIARLMPENIMLTLARLNGRYVAGALFFHDATTLYGRYWGCEQDYHNLHFETCYYQGIEYCIEKDLQRFDAGAQGEHKLRRGFEPVRTRSLHWIREPAFAKAIADFCREETAHIRQYEAAASDRLPYRRDDDRELVF